MAQEQQPGTAAPDTTTPDSAAPLIPEGVHADGTLCWHGIAQDAKPESSDSRWVTCQGGQQAIPHITPGAPALGKDGWELTATPCPQCGAADEVLVRHGAEGPEGPWDWYCPVCGAHGTGHPRTEPA
jgi:hypothetical protein